MNANEKLADTLRRNYCNNGRKVQVRRWNDERKKALLALGWDVYARRVGERWQLCFAPLPLAVSPNAAVNCEVCSPRGAFGDEMSTLAVVDGELAVWRGFWETLLGSWVEDGRVCGYTADDYCVEADCVDLVVMI